MQEFNIIADSSCDLTDELKEMMQVKTVPLTIRIDDHIYTDNENLDLLNMLKKMKASKQAPKTSSPSPDDFKKEFVSNICNFVVTLSSKLSGTYSSAQTASHIEQEEGSNKRIHIFDSLSASVGETLVAIKIFNAVKTGLSESEVIKSVSSYIKEMKTYFLLESLDNLVKAGRINKAIGKIASTLNIKPIMAGNEGAIKLIEKTRGSKQGLRKLIRLIGDSGVRLEERILGISHCQCPEKAEHIKSEVEKLYNFKDIIIVPTKGLSSVYANEGGVVIAF